jgi:type IV pilus assembly protein PilX
MNPASFHFGLPRAHRQRGVTLVIALIFLAVLALLGAAAAQNSVLEERMAGNTRDRDLAFQAAEAALKDAENLTRPFLDGNMGSPGLVDAHICTVPNQAPCYLSHGNDAAYWTNTFVWNTTNARNPAQSLALVAAQPLYIVEKMPDGPGGLGTYRATARGVGRSVNTVVIVQSVFNKP